MSGAASDKIDRSVQFSPKSDLQGSISQHGDSDVAVDARAVGDDYGIFNNGDPMELIGHYKSSDED